MSKRNLRSSGSILLISCYELGHQPLGIAWPFAFLRRAGYNPETLDFALEQFDTGRFARAQFIGISVPMHTALRLGVRVAERVRRINPDCHICFYGIYAFLNAEYLLENVADSAIGGEFETSLVALVEALDAGDPVDIEGVAIGVKNAKPLLKRLSFPMPDRSTLPSLRDYVYLEWNDSRRLAGYVEASRGCLHHCLHCPLPPVYGGRFFVVPQDIVLEDIRNLIHNGAEHITFGDPDFLNGPMHSLRVARATHQEFPKTTFDFTAKIEHIVKHRSLFPELKELGCIFMVSAVESLSDTVLTNLAKGHTRADVVDAMKVVRDAGIAFRPTWVAFTPWTTLDDYIAMLEFIYNEDLIYHVDPVQYTIRLLVPPGSALLSRPEIHFYLQPLNQPSFFYPWTHPDPRMDLLYQETKSIVEKTDELNEDPAITFNRVRTCAYALRGDRIACEKITTSHLLRPPRLTEPWFCCAEPTDYQLKVVETPAEISS